MYTIQMVSTTYCPLKAMSFGHLQCGEGKWNAHSKDNEGDEEPLVARL